MFRERPIQIALGGSHAPRQFTDPEGLGQIALHEGNGLFHAPVAAVGQIRVGLAREMMGGAVSVDQERVKTPDGPGLSAMFHDQRQGKVDSGRAARTGHNPTVVDKNFVRNRDDIGE